MMTDGFGVSVAVVLKRLEMKRFIVCGYEYILFPSTSYDFQARRMRLRGTRC